MTPFAPPFAADGVDELLSCFVPRRSTQLRAETPASLAVRCTRRGRGLAVAHRRRRRDDRHGPRRGRRIGDAACSVRGAAADLYLALWNRAGPEALAVEGDRAVLGLFLEQVQVRWA